MKIKFQIDFSDKFPYYKFFLWQNLTMMDQKGNRNLLVGEGTWFDCYFTIWLDEYE